MLHDGIIEESTSSCSSPIMVVPNPANSLRLYIDIRKLKTIFEFDSLPRVDDQETEDFPLHIYNAPFEGLLAGFSHP